MHDKGVDGEHHDRRTEQWNPEQFEIDERMDQVPLAAQEDGAKHDTGGDERGRRPGWVAWATIFMP